MTRLPFVSNEVGCSVAASLEVKPDTQLIKEGLAEISKVNPAVAEFIIKWSKMAKTKDAKRHSVFCGILVYKLLESQAEADWMNENL